MGKANRRNRQVTVHLQSRAVTDAELIAACRDTAENLSDGLDRMDRDSIAAARQVAAQVRVAFGGNRGDKLLERTCHRLGLPLPEVRVGPISATGRVPGFSLQGLPIDDDSGQVQRDSVLISMEQWLASPAVRTSRGGRVETTWRELVQEVANHYGAHAGTAIPALLDDFVHFDAGTRGLLWHVIYTTGALAERALHQIVGECNASEKEPRPTRVLQPGGVEITAIKVDTVDEQGGRVPVEVGFKVRDERERPIISLPMDGRRLAVSAVRDPGSGTLQTRFDWSEELSPRSPGLR